MEVEAFRSRPLDHTTYPYVWLDATYLKARKDHRIVSRAVVVATAVTAEGNREVLELDAGNSEDEELWTLFLRRLRERGLTGVKLVTSDAYAGLKAAITKALVGASWQRCRIHTMGNLRAKVPKGHSENGGRHGENHLRPTLTWPVPSCGWSLFPLETRGVNDLRQF